MSAHQSIWIPSAENMPNGRTPPVVASESILASGKLYMYKENDEEIDDGREERLLSFVHTHSSLPRLRNNPSAVADAVDEFGQTQDFLMTIGPLKRKTVWNTLSQMQRKPKIVLDLGAYIGYTAIALGGDLKAINGNDSAKVFSFELEPKWAAITSSLIELAGLKSIVDVCVGEAEKSLRRLVAEGQLQQGSVDAVMLDHWEDRYLPDLKVIEELDLLHEGSVIFADNVFFPGAPAYLEYVRNTKDNPIYESLEVESMMPNGWKVRGV
ncbi:MAG: hypothetical protein Q9227_003564 [Pyrenula ochraceoflavens]